MTEFPDVLTVTFFDLKTNKYFFYTSEYSDAINQNVNKYTVRISLVLITFCTTQQQIAQSYPSSAVAVGGFLHPKTFGNMIHPSVLSYFSLRDV